MRRPRKDNAFTLIELLVVISIIALLLAIMMPALGMVKEKARSLVCRTNVRQMTLAMAMYAEDNKGSSVPMIHSVGEYWFHQIAPYLGDNDYKDNPEKNIEGSMEVTFCPSTKRPSSADAYWFGGLNKSWKYLGGEGSYGMNLWLQSGKSGSFGTNPPLSNYPGNWFKKYSTVRGSVPVFSDSVWVGSWPFEQYEPVNDFMGSGYGTPNSPSFPDMETAYMARFLIDRHNMAVNVGFTDTSVGTLKLDEMWSVKWHQNFRTTKSIDLTKPYRPN
ncbi:type II secretion system protein G [Anaerohalosphaera lusitana]|uniref:Type II secretion system protein G n=1 Tax=Anaerohalosphaera lusitana TaxID=1936003 RepID=A0A1U9NMA6_9BACT|nr:type II secretion system protein [Anaerohalosphaera lusitana]AQT69082.1 type II secretion system protein G [Anaerohalosphaera lusitana]